MRGRLGCLVAVLLVAGGVSPAWATAYNLVSGFSSSNPNGVWSYVANGSTMGTFQSTCGVSGVECWTNGGSTPNLAEVEYDSTSNTFTNGTVQFEPGYLNIDPQGITNAGVLFTAPTSGTYSIVGSFVGEDTSGNPHPVSILLNGATSLYAGANITGTSSTDNFSINRSLTAGDTVLFTVGQGSNSPSYAYLSTGVTATITSPASVPEPGTLAVVGVGLLGLLVARRRSA